MFRDLFWQTDFWTVCHRALAWKLGWKAQACLYYKWIEKLTLSSMMLIMTHAVSVKLHTETVVKPGSEALNLQMSIIRLIRW